MSFPNLYLRSYLQSGFTFFAMKSVIGSRSPARVTRSHFGHPSIKRDNGNVHRATANIIVPKSRAARGSVCNVLLSHVWHFDRLGTKHSVQESCLGFRQVL